MKIDWINKKVKLSDVKEYEANPRTITEKGLKDLKQSIERFGQAEPLVVNTDMTLIGGHARKLALQSLDYDTCDVIIPSKKLTDKQVQELITKYRNQRNGRMLCCQECKQIFKPSGWQKKIIQFCSSKCYGQSIQKDRDCQECGEKLVYDTVNKRTNKKFCSKTCSIKFREKGITEEHKHNIKKSKIGKKLSEEHKKALSEAKIGKQIKHFIENKETVRAKISKALKGKPQPWNRGENHPNYTDGGKAKHQRQKAMGRVEYKNWRRSVFERDNYTCQDCGERGGNLVADHIKPWSLFKELRYELSNGKTLCKPCHIETPTYGGKIKTYLAV